MSDRDLDDLYQSVIFDHDQEQKLYRDTYEEAQRLIRISDEVRLAGLQAERHQHRLRAIARPVEVRQPMPRHPRLSSARSPSSNFQSSSGPGSQPK